jgi:hypothetical protein
MRGVSSTLPIQFKWSEPHLSRVCPDHALVQYLLSLMGSHYII